MAAIQIGSREFAKAGSESHVGIISQWLADCDKNHQECRQAASSSVRASLPTRLIDVGEPHSLTAKLVETVPGNQMRYTALSHPWGPPPYFCTTLKNIGQHKRSFRLQDFPATFLDAVNITRSLGVRYIWIDSICIIQGDEGDFKQEAPKMEDVFSSSYVVLAASWSKGQADGFLKPRRIREYIRIRHEEMPDLYICPFNDNFTKDVIESHLNSRGWVLQERALARRTIYFTDTQTYWECGQGVRSESFTKMHK